MNDLIEQLIEQAHVHSFRENYGRFNSSDFAEVLVDLVVRECMAQCEQVAADAAIMAKGMFVTPAGRTLHDGMWGGARNCGDQIKEHFGVKE
jgi:hypothetical protein